MLNSFVKVFVCLNLSVINFASTTQKIIKNIKERAEISHGTAGTLVQMLIDVKFLHRRIVENITFKWNKHFGRKTSMFIHHEKKKNHKV